jgi:hypothetical protein
LFGDYGEKSTRFAAIFPAPLFLGKSGLDAVKVESPTIYYPIKHNSIDQLSHNGRNSRLATELDISLERLSNLSGMPN